MNNEQMRIDDPFERVVEDIARRWIADGLRSARLIMPTTRRHRWVQTRPGFTYGQIVLVLVREDGRMNIREERTRDIVASVALS